MPTLGKSLFRVVWTKPLSRSKEQNKFVYRHSESNLGMFLDGKNGANQVQTLSYDFRGCLMGKFYFEQFGQIFM